MLTMWDSCLEVVKLPRLHIHGLTRIPWIIACNDNKKGLGDYIGIMEKNMETAMGFRVYLKV